MFYLAFPVGLVISFVLYYGLNRIWPPRGVGEYDDVDHFGTFSSDEASKLGVALPDEAVGNMEMDEISENFETDTIVMGKEGMK